ncbi:uncharacterized protein LOC108144269 [Drosophila elegans]|uniref:uncharacterized protein LOC108144269 n=1 Tax=Drosophila elegans TaxID=30023 RepID=UPI001BC82CE6|nr:uncharacterized protein LOC108144269 [Drosophila elegans]
MSSEEGTLDKTEEPPMPSSSVLAGAFDNHLQTVAPNMSSGHSIQEIIEEPHMSARFVDSSTSWMVEEKPKLPPPTARQLRRSQRIINRLKLRKEQQTTLSAALVKKKTRKVKKPKRIAPGDSLPWIKFYQCAELNGKLYKVRKISCEMLLGAAAKRQQNKTKIKNMKKTGPKKLKQSKKNCT